MICIVLPIICQDGRIHFISEGLTVSPQISNFEVVSCDRCCRSLQLREKPSESYVFMTFFSEISFFGLTYPFFGGLKIFTYYIGLPLTFSVPNFCTFP